MKIKSAEFVVSNSKVEQCPNSALPEYAFIGRSNVGKSSLINMLTDRKSLAKTSAKPGKTQLINHFLINKNWHLVDLPGYGYAQVSKSTKKVFQKFITAYFEKRTQMVCAFVLIDSRHAPQKIDMEFMQWLGEHNVPFCIIFTKADKLKPKVLEKNIHNYQAEMLEIWTQMPEFFITSASTGTGKDEVLDYIEAINQQLRENA
ncbi:MAG: ribosome biogenesis GTP-binding protein YihA/YsxC [Christiangramia sp.]|uniref:Probable GTP-binding protein EngB n=1 Tax=Christiangramia flava JLT2011 TaxID=1229726 RepID=A0A1L7I1I6_9FLAO|nr:ribosome biogenesis GTP-binding protein YihA/YsxC [Christiangramia flava]APU67466.1 GTP-binding protein EngB [Christiangramia flava JLT2011]MAM20057.1 YihA family ribosome biogenesis GTP-binding protein [Christiangramia sp.]OSS40052.1 GTP-binding protein EngB [Christiangramia flava JLT2011]